MPVNQPTRLLRPVVALAALTAIAGCGGGSGPTPVPATPRPSLTGVLVDSPVSGVRWQTAEGESGLTNAAGEFNYTVSAGSFTNTITFSIGDIELGTVLGAPFITMVELTSSFSPTDRAVLNQLVFLQSLDSDENPGNGISISPATRDAAVGQTLDFDAPDFGLQLEAVVAAIAPGNEIVSESDALDHFYRSYADLGGSDTFDFQFPGYPPVGQNAAEFVLAFADEFEAAGTPDPANWNIEQGYGPNNAGWGNNEWQLYTDSADNVRVEDGNLVITALCPRQPCGVRDGTITSARITTLDKFEFRYGKVVARIKMPVGQGTWPAFWSLGSNFPEVGWPRSGEIDFVEVYNNTYNTPGQRLTAQRTTTSAMHWCDESIVTDPEQNCFPAGRIFETDGFEWPERLDEDFHIWESDWTADRVTFSIDGVQYFELEIEPELMEEFRRDFFLLLNVAVGGTLGSGGQGPQGDETFPQTMLVDFVRVYQQVDDVSPPELSEVTVASSNANPDFATTGDVVTVSLTANEPILSPAVSIGGRAATTTLGSGASWQASRRLTAEDVDGVLAFTIDFTDLAGNDGLPVTASSDASRVTADGTAPELVNVSIASDNADPSLAAPGNIVTVTFNADEPIEAPTVTIGGIAVVPGGSGANWQASREVTSGEAEGVLTLTIDYADFAGNVGPAVSDTTDSSNVTVNTNAPGVSITGAPASFSTLSAIPVNIEFSKPVTGFDLADIAVINGSASGLVASAGDSYSAIVTPTGLGNLVIGIPAGAALDAGGLPSVAAADVVVSSALNASAPLLTAVGISSSNLNPASARAGDSISIAITASEPVTTPTVTIAGDPAAVTGSGNTFQATRVAQADDPEGPVEFAIGSFQALDDGTPGFQSTVTTDGSSVAFDVTAPSLTVNGLPASIDFLEPIPVTFQFSEAVLGFEAEDVQVINGTIGALVEVDAATYTAVVSPDGAGDFTVGVAAGVATDAPGNGNESASETRSVGSAWRLVWSDDFDVDGTPNADNWTVRSDADCPDPCDGMQSYSAARVNVAGGRLRIEARNEGGGTFSSGLIDSRDRRQFTFGRVEIDARMPGTQGTLPALRLLPAIPPGESEPAYGPFPQSGQIDIVNAPNLGPGNSLLEHTLRYGLVEPEDTTSTVTSQAPGLPTLDDIQYAIEWDGGEIRWFVDGVHVATQTDDNWYAYFQDADDDGDYDADGAFVLGDGAAPFDRDFYLAIGFAVGGNADSFFPQVLEIDAVRVYECANPVNPATGAGCSTGTGVPPISAPAAPYTEMLDLHVDGPATLAFLEPEGTTRQLTLNLDGVPGNPSNSAVSTPALVDGVNTVWNANMQAVVDQASVVLDGGEVSPNPGESLRYFDLSGGETAGELLFRMRVNSASENARLSASIGDRDFNTGQVPLEYVPDAQWRDYSVKLADLLAAAVLEREAVDIGDVLSIGFSVAAGSVNLDLDDIAIKVACRDQGGCEATPRTLSSIPATVVYTEDFEALDPDDEFALGGQFLGDGAGFLVFASVWDGEVGTGTFLYQYGPLVAPNGGAGFSAVAGGAFSEAGPEQGSQYLNIYSDYNNADHTPGQTCGSAGGSVGCTINSSVFLEQTIVAEDLGKCWNFSADYKSPFEDGIADPASNAETYAFIVTLDPNAGFSATNEVRFDTTGASNSEWSRFTIDVDLGDAALNGQILQFGFNTRATNFEDSGVFYDNLVISTRPGDCPPDP